MQSPYLSRSLFGCTRISLISAAVLVGTMLLPVKGAAQRQEIRNSRARLLNLPAWPSTRGCPRLYVS